METTQGNFTISKAIYFIHGTQQVFCVQQIQASQEVTVTQMIHFEKWMIGSIP